MDVNAKQLTTLLDEQTEQTVDLSTLDEESRSKVTEYMAQLDLQKSTSILEYGVKLQDEIARHADRVYEHVRVKDAGEAGNILGEMLTVINRVDVDKLMKKENSPLAKVPLIGKLFDKMQQFLLETKKTNDLLEELSDKLGRTKQQLLTDIEVLDTVYDRNMDYIKQIELHVIAAKKKVQDIRSTLLPELVKHAEETKDMADAQAVQNLQSQLNRLENKAHDLVLTRQARIQQAPIIRITQESHQNAAEKINTVIFTTVPLWKDAVTLSIAQERGAHAADILGQANATTNKLLTSISDKMKTQTIDLKMKVQSGVIDIATLKHLQQNTIETLQESIRIDREASARRVEAEKEIAVMNDDLKHKLIELAGQR